jgi:hypothetical protein
VLQIVLLLHLHLLFIFPAFHQNIIIHQIMIGKSNVMRIRKEVQEASKGNFRIECPYKKNFGMKFRNTIFHTSGF